MRKRVKPTAERVVRETVDQCRGFSGIGDSLRRATADSACKRTCGERGGDQRLLVEQRCRIDRAARPRAHRVVVAVVEAVADELDHELDALCRGGISETGERGLEVDVRLVVPSEEVLD